MTAPSAFLINGVRYAAANVESPFEEYSEPTVHQQPEIAGSSRPARQSKPGVLVWKHDDWSGGEGYKFFDVAKEELAKSRYYYSTSAVDVTTPGQVTLGYAVASSTSAGSSLQGPYLVSSRGIVSWLHNNILVVEGPLGTWTSKGNVAADSGNQIAGPARAQGGYIFAAYKDGTGAGSSSKVRRLIWDGTTLTQATFINSSGRENPLPADNRLHVYTDNSGKLEVRRTALTGTLPLAETLVYTVDNVGSECGTCAIGNRIFIASQYSNEEPRIHLWDGAKGVERAHMPLGFRMDTTPYNGLVALGDIVFAGGYRDGTTGWPRTPMLVYIAGDTVGTVALIREGIETARITTMASGWAHRLMMGTDTGRLYMYDMQTGGVSQYLSGVTSGQDITSILYYQGVYYVGSRNATSGTSGTAVIYKSVASGTGKYVATSTIQGSTWDFGYPEETKILREIEVLTAPLPANTSVSVQVSIDGGAAITTDAAGATMTHSGTGATRTRFTVSSTSVQRLFHYAQPLIKLDTSDTSVSPTVQAVTMRARATGIQRYFRVWLKLEDETASSRRPSAQLSGRKQATNLNTLVTNAEALDTTTARLFNFQPLYTDSKNLPQGNATTFVVQLLSHRKILTTKGEGVAELVLERVS